MVPSGFFSGPDVTLSEGKESLIGMGGKIISGNDILNDYDRLFIDNCSNAGGSLRNVVKGKENYYSLLAIVLIM